jgi:integrase
LENTGRETPPQGLPHETQSPTPPGHHAAPDRIKKTPGAGTLGLLARAWSQGRPSSDLNARTALYIEGTWNNRTPESLTPAEILTLSTTWDKTLAPATSHGYNKALRSFLRFVDEEAHTKLARFVPRRTQPQPRQLTCPDDDFQRILAESPPWLRFFLLLTRNIGMRHSEALALTPASLNEENSSILFHRKLNGASNLPVPEELITAIRFATTQDPNRPILQTLGGPTTQQNVRKAFDRAKSKAGVRPDLRIHDLRRTLGTRVYEQTKDIRIVQQILGHRNLNSTLPYLAPVSQDTVLKAMNDAAPTNIDKLPLATELKQ